MTLQLIVYVSRSFPNISAFFSKAGSRCMVMNRVGGRLPLQLRPITVSYGVYPYAAGSVLFEIGNTRVLCAVSLQQGVPPFLRGKKTGWLTAEYSLLPASTPTRTVREATTNKRSGRTVEISRLIGRSLRAVVNLDPLGEQTVTIDCDVLQADGGTRAASICGAFLALGAAERQWLSKGIISRSIIRDELAAISVGVGEKGALLDLDYSEDCAVSADFNFVLTRAGNIVEIQGAAEKEPVSFTDYDALRDAAISGVRDIFAMYDQVRTPERQGIQSVLMRHLNV